MLAIALSIVVMSLLTLIEIGSGQRLTHGRLLNLCVWVLRLGIGSAVLPLMALSWRTSLIDARTLPYVLGFSLFFLVMDLAEYLFHRAQHAIPWLWKLHALHHSDPDMNATTTERHFWGDQLLKALTVWPAASAIIHPSASIAFTYMFVTLWNYVCHSRLPLSFGVCSWVLNCPAYHRRHHSALAEHHNSNFAALLPIWDVIFGSYHVPSGGFAPTGLDARPPNTAAILFWPLSSQRM